MGLVTGLLGIGGRGADFTAQSADITNPFSFAPIQQSMQTAQGARDQALRTAAGIAPSAFLGLQRQNQTYGQMQDLGQQLAANARGEGPNPAQALLANQTGQNVAQTAALIAGQRGASANPGMIARQAAQQGAGIQQNAVGQAAALQAQQQLAAQSALQQQQAAQAALAGQQVGQGVVGAQLGTQAAQGYLQNQEALLDSYNKLKLGNVQQQNAANAGVASEGAKGGSGLVGGLLKGVGSAIGLAHGGEVPRYEVGGVVEASVGPRSETARLMMRPTATPTPAAPTEADRLAADAARLQSLRVVSEENARTRGMLKSGIDTPMVRSASGELKRDPLGGYAAGGKVMKAGGKVPGQAKVAGDSLKNDTVDAKLSPGEIVLPRSVAQAPDAPAQAAAFVAAVMAQRRRR